jgi:flagellar biosynthesis/type III secretory pathway chaperone
MDANVETPTDLKSLLQAELIGYTNLHTALGKEKQFLIQRDFDAFAQVLQDKHLLVNQLDTLAKHRMTVLDALKLARDESGMQAWIERQAEFGRDQLFKNWREIKALVVKCNHQNEVNAKIAHRAQATSKQILNILKGASLQESLYDKRGNANGTGAGLHITEA